MTLPSYLPEIPQVFEDLILKLPSPMIVGL